jgi:hypothetical protein
MILIHRHPFQGVGVGRLASALLKCGHTGRADQGLVSGRLQLIYVVRGLSK